MASGSLLQYTERAFGIAWSGGRGTLSSGISAVDQKIFKICK